MKRLFSLVLILALALSLFSCEVIDQINDRINRVSTTTNDNSAVGEPPEDDGKIHEYTGVPITELIYETVDYMGGHTVTYILDLSENKVYRKEYFPYFEHSEELSLKVLESEQYKNNNVKIEINTFTEEEEKAFTDACYSYGLFHLDREYKPKDIVFDGSGWELVLHFENGSSRVSEGSNAAPGEIFNKCAMLFYELCGVRVLGYIPPTFYEPPHLQTYFNSESKTEIGAMGIRADYKWGRFSSDDGDLFEINQRNTELELWADKKYRITFSTHGDMYYRGYEKFERFVFKSYDFNEALTGEKVLEDCGWFSEYDHSLCFLLEMNKIYVYELYYANGDYVRYTFNTKVHTDKPKLSLSMSQRNEKTGEEKKDIRTPQSLVGYDWCGESYEAASGDILFKNDSLKKPNITWEDKYSLTLSTAGYELEHFERLVLKSYDYGDALANEQTVLECEWFDGEQTVELETNKIYIYVLYFANGESVAYTFNTR